MNLLMVNYLHKYIRNGHRSTTCIKAQYIKKDKSEINITLLSILGMEDTSDHVLPSSSPMLTDEEEAELYIRDTLRSQKEFEGMDLNQVY